MAASGVLNMLLSRAQLQYVVFDVGGQRSERKKWWAFRVSAVATAMSDAQLHGQDSLL